MTKLSISKATIEDVPTIQRLVNDFAERGLMLARPLSELYENLRDFCVARSGEMVVGCCALHISWSDLAEIKSLAVETAWQGQGIGRALTQACLDEAISLGLEKVFALTLVPGLFGKMGFSQQSMDTLPRKVWGECTRCVKFPNCDEVAMVWEYESKRGG